MKIAFTGKGGVGKTTLSAMFIKVLAETKREVLAVDCDPDSNLGFTLGFKDADKIVPIVKMEKLIRERMGVSDDGSFFKLNPHIDDVPDKFSMTGGNIKLVVMGGMKKGGSGCACPENTFVKNLIEHMVLSRDEDVVMDMEAGVEHFGRGTAEGCDSVLVVCEPSQKSIQSARKIALLAKDFKIKNFFALANKVKSPEDDSFIKNNLKGVAEIIESFPFDDKVAEMDKTGNFLNLSATFSDKMKNVEQRLSHK